MTFAAKRAELLRLTLRVSIVLPLLENGEPAGVSEREPQQEFFCIPPQRYPIVFYHKGIPIVIDRYAGSIVFSQRFREFQIKQSKIISFTCVFTEIQRFLIKNVVFSWPGTEILEILMIFQL